MKRYNETEIGEALKSIDPAWQRNNDFIEREFKFRNFSIAFAFMTAVAFECEKADHHPNWENVYNRVKVALSTHSAGGLTEKDFALAGKIDTICSDFL